MSKRLKAAKEKRETYEGAPCPHCGNTERKVTTGKCADESCHKKQIREANIRHRAKLKDLLKG